MLCLLMALPARAGLAWAPRDADSLFRDEIRQAATGLHWHGERLTDDCSYAAALTGASWESAWGKEHLFWLGWADCKERGKRPATRERGAEDEIRNGFSDRDYRRVVGVAMNAFSLEQISCDPDLKEAVGTSFLEMGQPERAFPIFASPFKALHVTRDLIERNRSFRERAREAAVRAGLRKEAIAFEMSLLLEPGGERPEVNTHALDALFQEGVDIDRIVLGILAAPPRLRGLPDYTYVAADLLVLRARPQMLPLLMELAESDDVYLRARALLGLGILAYRARPNEGDGEWRRIVPVALRETGISEGQRAMVAQAALRAAHDGRYRLRAAGALALGLIGDDANLPLLRQLAHDHAYVLFPAPPGEDHRQHIVFPVRLTAAAVLPRFGERGELCDETLAPRALDLARHGNQDVTHDRSGLRQVVYSALAISPTDVSLPITFGSRE